MGVSDALGVNTRRSVYCFRAVICVVSMRTPALCRPFVRSSEAIIPSTMSIETLQCPDGWVTVSGPVGGVLSSAAQRWYSVGELNEWLLPQLPN